MAAGRPARALRQPRRVVRIADENSAACLLFLEVTFQAQGLVALGEHSRIHRAVRRVAAHATFFQRFMLKHEWSRLRDMALETSFVLAEQQSSAAFNLLRKTRSAPFDRSADVRVVAVGATHFAFQHRMVMRHFESGPHFQVALEAGVR